VAHHGDEHVDEDDDDGDVVERKEEHADALDDRRGRVAAREAHRVLAAVLLGRVLDLDAVHRHQAEHRPEQAEQRARQPASTTHTARQGRLLEMCMGMGFPFSWDSHGNPMGMGTEICQKWEWEWEE